MVSTKVLRKARLAGGFTLREVGSVVQVDPSTIVSYELGRGRPSQATARRWHDALITLLETRSEAAASAVATLRERAIEADQPNRRGDSEARVLEQA